MEITHVLVGTLTLDPGVNVARVLDLPAGFPLNGPERRLSRVSPVDSADLAIFKLERFTAASPSSRDNFVGAHQFTLEYTLAGVDPIDVDIDLAWVIGASPVAVGYGGV